MKQGYRWLLACAALLLMHAAGGQTTYRLSGKLLAEDFNPLYNASVYLAGFSTGTFTDSAGEFHLNLKPGLHQVSFSYIGYKTETLNLFITHDTAIEVQMKTDLQMAAVVVVDKAKMRAADHDETGTITLRKENFLAVPALLGENDPMRAVQMQPGVQSGNEGATGIFVRGGSPDQNLILIDGTPVINPSHIYGFVSVFNGDAIDRLDVYKDAYPARFGNSLGSVMAVEMDPGNSNAITGSATIGIITSRIHFEGPLDKKHKTTFAVSVRGCYVGLFTGPISQHQYKAAGYSGDIAYYFDDVNFKLVHQFSDKDRLELSYFSNNDFYKFVRNTSDENGPAGGLINVIQQTSQQINWSNYVASLAWVHTFNSRWNERTTLAYTGYHTISKVSTHYEEQYISTGDDFKDFENTSLKSYINELSLKTDVTYKPQGMQTFRMGAELNGSMFQTGKGYAGELFGYDSFSYQQNPSYNKYVRAAQSVIYIEDNIVPSEKWLFNCGFHFNTYSATGETFVSLLPRANIAFTPVKNFTIRASVAGTQQNMHLLTTSSTDILEDNYVPAIASAPPETGWNYSGGVIQKLPLNFEWSVDGFYRSIKNLIDYQEGADYSFLNSSWNQQIVAGGTGRAYGLETYIARSFGRVTGSVAYTLACSDRKFTDLNNGNWFPYKYDRRHDIAAQLNFLVNKHIELGSVWVYGSGNMVTLPQQYYTSWNSVSYYNYLVQNGYNRAWAGEELPVYNGKNGYRLPSYQHLDLSFIYKMKVRRLEHQFNFSIYNVYNHFNVFAVYTESSVSASGSISEVYKKLSLFPILPSFAYTVKFGV